MSYGDVKEVARDLTKLALNGSPYWRLLVTGVLALLIAFAAYAQNTHATKQELVALEKRRDDKLAAVIKPITDDIAEIKEQQAKNRLNDISGALLNARRDQCAAAREGRNARGWTERISELAQEYFELTRRTFDIPGCGEV